MMWTATGILLCASLAACGQRLTTDSELETRVADLKDTMQCRHLGNADLAVKPQLYPLGKEAKMTEDLLVKARNLASEIGADTVVPAGGIDEGKQTFRLYICSAKNH